MADQAVLFDVLRRFARTMAGTYDVNEALQTLSEAAVEVFGATAAGVALCDGDELRFVTATNEAASRVEAEQERAQAGPCYTSLEQCRPVPVRDVREHHADWPEYCPVAEDAGFLSVLGLPLLLDDRRVGSIDIYAAEPREWSEDEVSAGVVLADIAAAYVLNASQLANSQRTAEQLQHALDNRVIIEQAKGKLAGELGVSPNDAFEMLRRYSRSHQVSVRTTAQAVVDRGAEAIDGTGSGPGRP